MPGHKSVNFSDVSEHTPTHPSHSLSVESEGQQNHIVKLLLHADEIKECISYIKEAVSAVTGVVEPVYNTDQSVEQCKTVYAKLIPHGKFANIPNNTSYMFLVSRLLMSLVASEFAGVSVKYGNSAKVLAHSFYASVTHGNYHGNVSLPFLETDGDEKAYELLSIASMSLQDFKNALFGLVQAPETVDLLNSRFQEIDQNHDGVVGFGEFAVGVGGWFAV